MDFNKISPSNGDGEAKLEQENEMDSKLMPQYNRRNQPMVSNSFSSVTEHWMERVTQTEGLLNVMQQWCKREIPVIQDLKVLAPCIFANECTTPGGKKCSSTMCKAATMLKAECQSFLECVDAYAVARVAHADAVEKHNNIKTQSDQHDTISSEKLASINAKLVAVTKMVVSKDAEAVAAKAQKIFDRHFGVRITLQALRASGNNASLVTTESQASKTQSYRKSVSFPPDFDTLCSPCEVELDNVDFLPVLEDEDVNLLVLFYTHLMSGFGIASVLASDDERYTYKIDQTVNAVNGWKVDDNLSSGSSTIQFFAPACVGQELAGVHPILCAITFKMTQVLGFERHFIHDQVMQKVETRSVRCVDFVVSSLAEEYSSTTSAALLADLPIKCKPVARKLYQLEQLLVEALNQVLRHLAKKAMYFFDFGGIGEDCTVVGLALSMGYVVVVVLELSGVGTENVRITTKRTKCAPLFDKETRKNLFGEKESEVAALIEHVDEQHGMPTGFCLLARTLISAQFGPGASLMKRSEGCRDTFSVLVDNAEPIVAGPTLDPKHIHAY